MHHENGTENSALGIERRRESVAVPDRPARKMSTPPPEPPKHHPVRTAVIWLVILILVGGAVWRIMQTRDAAAKKQLAAGARGGAGGFPVPVVVDTVKQKDVPIYLDGLGTIQALNTVTVRARVDGQIVKVAFAEGQDVKKGEVLVEIDPAPYKAALDQALAKQRTDQSQLDNANIDMTRDEDLIRKKVISQQQYDTQKALVNQLTATVQNDVAAVETAKVNLDYCTIVAPFDGRTGIRLVDEGNLVHATDSTGIVVLTQLHPISLVFTLPEQTLQRIHDAQQETPELKVIAVGRDNKTVLDEGKLTVIDNQIDITTGTVKLKAEFPNEKLQLWPGQFVNARLLLTIRKNGVVVPAAVVQRGPDNSYAYLVAQDPEKGPVAEMRTITVAQIDGSEALIDEGLKAGETVVVDGQYKLTPGAKLNLGGGQGGGATHGGGGPQGHGGHAGAGRGPGGKPPEQAKSEGAAATP